MNNKGKNIFLKLALFLIDEAEVFAKDNTNSKDNSLIWFWKILPLLISFTILIIVSVFPFQNFGCWSTISINVSKAAFPLEFSISTLPWPFSYFNVSIRAASILSVSSENCNNIFSFSTLIKNWVTQFNEDTFTSISGSSNPFEKIPLKLFIAPGSNTLSFMAFNVHKTSIIKIANFLLKAFAWSSNHFNISTNPFERFVTWYKGASASAKRCKLFHDFPPAKSIFDLIKLINVLLSSGESASNFFESSQNVFLKRSVLSWKMFSTFEDIPSAKTGSDWAIGSCFNCSKDFSAFSRMSFWGDIRFSKSWMELDCIFLANKEYKK